MRQRIHKLVPDTNLGGEANLRMKKAPLFESGAFD
jgi:hypothetical protein